MKIVKQFHLKIVIFTAVKNRCILHGRVFLMVKYQIRNQPEAMAQSIVSLTRSFEVNLFSVCI